MTESPGNTVRIIIELPAGFEHLIAELTSDKLANKLLEKIAGGADVTFKARLPGHSVSFADILEEVKVLFSPGCWFTIEEYKLRAGIKNHNTAAQRLSRLAKESFLDKRNEKGRGSPVSYCIPQGERYLEELDHVLKENRQQQLQQMREGY